MGLLLPSLVKPKNHGILLPVLRSRLAAAPYSMTTRFSNVNKAIKKNREPSKEYLALSLKESKLLEEPRSTKPLLILDLNGSLISRLGRRGGRAPRNMYVRPYFDDFLEFAFKHFSVMVWSSAQPHSVATMCQAFGDYTQKLVQVWDRLYFDLTREEYHSKTPTIKDLNIVWNFWKNNYETGKYQYDATNTVLIDDSPAKTVVQPYNAIHISTFDHNVHAFKNHGERELLNIIQYLDTVRKQSNICAYMRKHPYKSSDSLQDPDKQNLTKVVYYRWNGMMFHRQLKDLAAAQVVEQKEEDILDKLRKLEL